MGRVVGILAERRRCGTVHGESYAKVQRKHDEGPWVQAGNNAVASGVDPCSCRPDLDAGRRGSHLARLSRPYRPRHDHANDRPRPV